MHRKALLTAAVMAAVLGSASSAMAGPDQPTDTTRSAIATQLAAAGGTASGARLYRYCGNGASGTFWTNDNGWIIGYDVTLDPACEGEMRISLA